MGSDHHADDTDQTEQREGCVPRRADRCVELADRHDHRQSDEQREGNVTDQDRPDEENRKHDGRCDAEGQLRGALLLDEFDLLLGHPLLTGDVLEPDEPAPDTGDRCRHGLTLELLSVRLRDGFGETLVLPGRGRQVVALRVVVE